MRNAALVTLALLAAYSLGSLQRPAQADADDQARIRDALRDLVRHEAVQAEALRTLARQGERCTR